MLFLLFFNLEEALELVARGRGDSDHVLARSQEGDVDGVVHAVDLGGNDREPCRHRLDLHIIVSHFPATVNDNDLGTIVIVHVRLVKRNGLIKMSAPRRPLLNVYLLLIPHVGKILTTLTHDSINMTMQAINCFCFILVYDLVVVK